MAPQSKSVRTAERIAGEAARLFFERGYRETTVGDIAAAAGVATGTVLLHYHSKAGLATAAFARRIGVAVDDTISSLPDGAIEDQLRHIVGRLFTWYDQHQPVAETLLREALFQNGPAAADYATTVTRTINSFESIITTHQAAGAIAADINPAVAAEALLGHYLLVLMLGLRGQITDLAAQVERFLAMARMTLG